MLLLICPPRVGYGLVSPSEDVVSLPGVYRGGGNFATTSARVESWVRLTRSAAVWGAVSSSGWSYGPGGCSGMVRGHSRM